MHPTKCLRALSITAALFATHALSMTLVVVPPVTISGEVPPQTLRRLHPIILDELQTNEAIGSVKPAPAATDATMELSAQRGKSALSHARTALDARRFRESEKYLAIAIESLKAAASTQSSIEDLAEAYELLAVTHYALGQDEQGASALLQMFALTPQRAVKAAHQSPLFNNIVDEQRRASEAQARGELHFDTTPPGFPIEVDGSFQGTSPLIVGNIPAGLHVYRVHLPLRAPVGGVAVVAPARRETIQVTVPNTTIADRLVARLVRNTLDTLFLDPVKEFATENRADAVLILGLERSTDGFTLHSCWYDLHSESLRRLPSVHFDVELLSARLRIAPWARQLTPPSIAELPPLQLPTTLAEALPTASTGAIRMTRFHDGRPSTIDPNAIAVPSDRGASPSAGRPHRRVPLRATDSRQGLKLK